MAKLIKRLFILFVIAAFACALYLIWMEAVNAAKKQNDKVNNPDKYKKVVKRTQYTPTKPKKKFKASPIDRL